MGMLGSSGYEHVMAKLLLCEPQTHEEETRVPHLLQVRALSARELRSRVHKAPLLDVANTL